MQEDEVKAEQDAAQKFLGTKLTFDVPSAGFSALRVDGGEPLFYVAINQDLNLSSEEADAFVARFCGSWNALNRIKEDPEGFMREVKEVLGPLGKYGAVLCGQRVRGDDVLIELWEHKITVDDLRKVAALLSQMEGK